MLLMSSSSSLLLMLLASYLRLLIHLIFLPMMFKVVFRAATLQTNEKVFVLWMLCDVAIIAFACNFCCILLFGVLQQKFIVFAAVLCAVSDEILIRKIENMRLQKLNEIRAENGIGWYLCSVHSSNITSPS